MTAQHPDFVMIDGVSYYLSAVDGDGLFDPADYGMTTRVLSTGCYRGYICKYAVTAERQLVLHSLEIGLEPQPEQPIRIGGSLPGSDLGPAYSETYYPAIDLRFAFTGRLLLGDEWLVGPHMGFQPGWSFAHVLDVHFQNGRVMAMDDVSAEMARIRDARREAPRRRREGAELSRWIERTFSLSYAYAWPDSSHD